MPALSLLFALLLALTGCAPPIDYERSRRACGLPADASQPASLDTAAPTLSGSISPLCARQLAQDIGLDWDDFGGEPGPVTAAVLPHDKVLTGLFVGLAADFGPISDLLRRPDLPDWLRREVEQVARKRGLTAADPAGWPLYEVAASAILATELERDLPVEARYESGLVLVGDGDTLQRVSGIGMWALIVHEVAHRWQPGHSRCPSDGEDACDADASGPLGAEALVADLYTGGLERAALDDPFLCREARWSRFAACSRILDTRGAPACLIPPASSCDPVQAPW